jgi:hypothetical protein
MIIIKVLTEYGLDKVLMSRGEVKEKLSKI